MGSEKLRAINDCKIYLRGRSIPEFNFLVQLTDNIVKKHAQADRMKST